MNKIFNIARTILSFCIVIFLIYYVCFHNKSIIVELPNTDFIVTEGIGSKEDPFLISSEEQFASFRDSVNNGNEYTDYYFLQTKDLDLKVYDFWVPIGEYASGNYFFGTYDGGGHTISNLNCDGNNSTNGNVGLFGQLGGTVMNLGIESGLIAGEYVGGISSHCVGTNAIIINCYSKSDIVATGRGGGIADNFSGGYIANTWFSGKISAEVSGGICSYNAQAIYSCYSNQPLYTDTFNGYIKHPNYTFAEPDSNEKQIELLNNNLKKCEKFFKIDRGTLVTWSLSNGNIILMS